MRVTSIRARAASVAVCAVALFGCASADVIEADGATSTTVDDELILESVDGGPKRPEVVDDTDGESRSGDSGGKLGGRAGGSGAGSRSPSNVDGPVVNRSSGGAPSAANGGSGSPLAIDGGSGSPSGTPTPNGAAPTPNTPGADPTVPPRSPTTTSPRPTPTTPTTQPGVSFEPPMRAGVQHSATPVTASQRVQTVTFSSTPDSPSALWRLESCDGFDYRKVGSTWVQAGWSTDSSCDAARIVLGLQPTTLTRSIPSGAPSGEHRFCTFLEEYGADGLTGRVDVTCAAYTIR